MGEPRPSAPSIEIGGRVRALREARGLSVRALAQASGLSPNALSHIERGLVSPSISSLSRLAAALQAPITTFFEVDDGRAAAVFVKADRRTRVPFLRGLLEGLGGEKFAGQVQPFYLTLDAGGNSGPHTVVHTGHEFVFCVRGALEYTVESATYLLEAGDSLLFAAHLRHRWRNPGRTVVNAIIVITGLAGDERPEALHLLAPSDA